MTADGRSFIINLCPTGMVPTRAQDPHVPVTPEEIAADCEACARLGASILHLHARDGEQRPDWRTERFSEILAAVRARCPDAIVCVTTSGRQVREVEKRAASLLATPRPDMGSLTLGSLNFMNEASPNEPAVIEALARAMAERGIVPELEVFDVGMARYARHLIAKGVLKPPFYFNILLGNVATAGCQPADLAAIVKELPEGAVWCVAGIGRAQLAANVVGLLFGHGVRVGLEDNIYFEGKEPTTNPRLVQRIVAIGEHLGMRPMPAAAVREKLGMAPARSSVAARSP